MTILFNIFVYILQHFNNSFNVEVVLFSLVFWVIHSFFRMIQL